MPLLVRRLAEPTRPSATPASDTARKTSMWKEILPPRPSWGLQVAFQSHFFSRCCAIITGGVPSTGLAALALCSLLKRNHIQLINPPGSPTPRCHDVAQPGGAVGQWMGRLGGGSQMRIDIDFISEGDALRQTPNYRLKQIEVGRLSA